MNGSSLVVTGFLEKLQEYENLLGKISNHWRKYVPIAKSGISPVSGRSFTIHSKDGKREFHGCIVIGIDVKTNPSIFKSLEFNIYLLWDNDTWYILTEVAEISDEGMVVLREFPERKTEDLSVCFQYLKEAIEDLRQCEDIVIATTPNKS
jgi:hypothetical protein